MTAPATTRTPRRTPAERARDLALVATFAALIAACSLTSVAFSAVPVPITLQTFAVLLAGAVLGPWRGTTAVGLYLAVGAAGVPVFAGGTGGLASFAGPSGGYLMAFPLAALVVGLAVRAAGRRGAVGTAVAVAVGALVATAVTYAIGVPVLAGRTAMDLAAAWTFNWVFVPFDLVKAGLVVVAAPTVLRAFPALRGGRAPQPSPFATELAAA
ncbi:biotin transporter BioY [Sanguibacter massiliensis]|uniref:biotin transporter BioY n=1 Tax=Sanguibacter massiliensis TaxID=1973217 RepID=UPI000C84625D|nr:biotin transporter BioY [Sanguibacter massiliensis]